MTPSIVADSGVPAPLPWSRWSLSELLDLKAQQGLRISLVVPARNEAATVGSVISRVRDQVLETSDLLDELVVIDSDSSDQTYALAEAAGAKVFRAAQIRPDLGWFPGKGEAMWKSQFVTESDLVVFMDADLTDWDTHFIPGLLGPLLTDPDVHLVKGCYQRPLQTGVTAEASAGLVDQAWEGGRVTELVARPLLALFWPALAGLVQPLAGEWAIRRSTLATLAVPHGYAVELAALVDVAHALGPQAIAQVDLGVRAHRHQALRDLGAMATQVLAAAAARIPGTPVMPDSVELRQFHAPGVQAAAGSVEGANQSAPRRVELGARPPFRDVEEGS